MKKAITVILAIALLAALALPAVADAFTLYVTQSGVRVYAKKSTSAKVYHKLSRGQKVLIEKKSGSWYAILVEDPEGGQTLGWIQAKYLSTTKPSRKKKSSQSTTAAVTSSSAKEIERVLGTMREVEPYDAEVVTKTEKGTVALRRKPTQAGQLIIHLANGTALRVLAEGEDWFQVTEPASGRTGYMASRYIVRTADLADDGDEDTGAAQAGIPTDGPREVKPIEVMLDINHLPDGEYPVSFDRGDAARLASGTYMNAVHIYGMDLYAAADLENLTAGDTVLVEGRTVAVTSVENRGDDILVNGGLDTADGCQFTRNDDGRYRVNGLNDLPTYTELGVTSLVVDESAVFTDSADIESDPVTVQYDGIIDAIQGATFSDFSASNTTVTIKSGKVVRIDRTYVP